MEKSATIRREQAVHINAKNAMNVARDLIGVPFKDYGRDSKSGLDCWGLAIEFFSRLGLQLEDPVSMYDSDWHKKFNLIGMNQHLYFDRAEVPIPFSVVAMQIQSNVVNHLAICLDLQYVLNTDKTVGVHMIRRFAIRPFIRYYLKPRNLVVHA